MDLGCLDLGCISVSDKHSNDSVSETQVKEPDLVESIPSASNAGKNKNSKENGQSILSSINKSTSQIKKPPHRKGSPLNWFPRIKVEPYLKRKIKMLQEVDGMNLTLDETLGDSNPHYSRVLREKMAAKEAAHKAMDARKAALVEASWCRILRAARIQSKEAEALLLNAEKAAAEAFEAATALGVKMYDIPNCPRKRCQIESSSPPGGGSTTHTITASFETAFEVDKEVASAVKTAFTRLANCPSFGKGEFKELLRQNPDTIDHNPDLSECFSECGSECESDVDLSCKVGASSQYPDFSRSVVDIRQRSKRRQSFEKLNMAKIVDMMYDRLQCLQEGELSSIATIVATCGLSAALAEVGDSKLSNPGSSASTLNIPRRMSSFGNGATKKTIFKDELELPSLDKFLVKHVSKLEMEVQEAKKARKNASMERAGENSNIADNGLGNSDGISSSETFPDLGSILVKHSSKFAKEMEEAKKNAGQYLRTGHRTSNNESTSTEFIPDLGSVLVNKHSSKLTKEIEETQKGNSSQNDATESKYMGRMASKAASLPELPSLDKCMVKHVSRLEKEIQEAKERRKNDHIGASLQSDKENVDSNKEVNRNSENHNLRLEKQGQRNVPTDYESLDNVFVKHVPRPEKEKIKYKSSEIVVKVKSSSRASMHSQINQEGGLDQIMVKHKSRLEKEKMEAAAAAEQSGNQISLSVTRKQTREKELQETWGGISFGNSKHPHEKQQACNGEEGGVDQIMVKHKSRLETEKIAVVEQPVNQPTSFVSRKEAREKELQDTWGGMSLGNSIRPRVSKLEREKAAWIKAENEERRQAMKEV